MSAIDTKVIIQGSDTIYSRTQDCTPIAERAKAMQSEGMHGGKEMRLAADIPMVIVEKYCNDNNLLFSDFMADPEHMRRVVNSPDNAMFRIWPGKI